MTNTKHTASAKKGLPEKEKGVVSEERAPRNASEYSKQLREKQKVKQMYGAREASFRKVFAEATHQKGATGEALLVLLERRIDNVIFRLKMAKTRKQARQMIVHGHVLVNDKIVTSPSSLVSVGDVITLHQSTQKMPEFMAQVVDKLMKMAMKTPEWLELDKQARTGRILRLPVRNDIQSASPIAEQLIVGFYSK